MGPTRSDHGSSTPPPANDLQGWKDIAAYLGKSVRAAQQEARGRLKHQSGGCRGTRIDMRIFAAANGWTRTALAFTAPLPGGSQ